MESVRRLLFTKDALHQVDRLETSERTVEYYAMFLGVLKAAGDLCTNNRAGSYGPPSSNFLNSDDGYMQTLWLKISRLLNMVDLKRQTLVEGGWEAWQDFDRGVFADSLIDLINYTAFWATDIKLSGHWPEGLQAQPEPHYPEVTCPGEVGVETVQCPRCQSLRHGFFGRIDDEWVIGCKSCGIRRTSQQAGSLLSWYAETRGARSFVRGRYGSQGDPTHQVKTPEIKTVPRPNLSTPEKVEEFLGMGTQVEALPGATPGKTVDLTVVAEQGRDLTEPYQLRERLAEIRRSLEDAIDLTPEDIVALTHELRDLKTRHANILRDWEGLSKAPPLKKAPEVAIQSNRSLPRTLGVKPSGGMHRNPIDEDEDEGVRPDVQPETSEKDPVQSVPCSCGNEADVYLVKVPLDVVKAKKWKGKSTCLRLRCKSCGQDELGVDMRQLSRLIEGQKLKRQTTPVTASKPEPKPTKKPTRQASKR